METSAIRLKYSCTTVKRLARYTRVSASIKTLLNPCQVPWTLSLQ